MHKVINKFIGLMFLCSLFAVIWLVQPALAADKKEILIGAHLSLSGDASLVGAEQKWAYEKAVEDINKAGGIYVKEYGKKLPVRLVIADDESDPARVKVVLKKLITKTKVDLLLSGQIGLLVLPGMITAEEHQIYYHGTVVWTLNFLPYNFQWCSMYFFPIEAAAAIPYELWNSLPEEQRFKRVAILVDDNFEDLQLADAWKANDDKYGFDVCAREILPKGSKEFYKQISKAKASNADAMILFVDVPDAVTCVQQMKEMDYNIKSVFGFKGTWATDFYNALGEDADYIVCDGWWSEDYPFPGAKELGERFYKDFGRRSVQVGTYYALCQILWQAMEKAGTLDSAKVRQAVLDNEFETVNGPADYDENGVSFYPLAAAQWYKGKREVVFPLDRSSSKLKIAPPWKER